MLISYTLTLKRIYFVLSHFLDVSMHSLYVLTSFSFSRVTSILFIVKKSLLNQTFMSCIVNKGSGPHLNKRMFQNMEYGLNLQRTLPLWQQNFNPI